METSLGKTARPVAVWYMRLAFEPQTGRQKILQDIRLRLFDDPGALLEDVARLAKRMGRLAEIEPHLRWLRGRVPQATQ